MHRMKTVSLLEQRQIETDMHDERNRKSADNLVFKILITS